MSRKLLLAVALFVLVCPAPLSAATATSLVDFNEVQGWARPGAWGYPYYSGQAWSKTTSQGGTIEVHNAMFYTNYIKPDTVYGVHSFWDGGSIAVHVGPSNVSHFSFDLISGTGGVQHLYLVWLEDVSGGGPFPINVVHYDPLDLPGSTTITVNVPDAAVGQVGLSVTSQQHSLGWSFYIDNVTWSHEGTANAEYSLDGQILDGSTTETRTVDGSNTFYAQVPLGLELRLALLNKGEAVHAHYQLGAATFLQPLAPKTLYPSNVVLEYDRDTASTEKVFRAVHLGTQTLTITPDDAALPPITGTIGTFDPGELGDGNTFDNAFVLWGNRRGIPPHIVKGLVRKETSNLDPYEYRYEPLNPTTGDRGIQKVVTSSPYLHYRLADTKNNLPKGDLLLDLNFGDTYSTNDDISPRKAFVLPRGDKNVLIPIRPVDVCPACVSAREIVEANDKKQNWTDPKNAGSEIDWTDPDKLKMLEFTAQTPLAASYGLMQVMYVTAIDLHWAANDGAQNPSLLFDSPANWANGGGSLAVGTLKFYRSYRDSTGAVDLASDPTFKNSDEYRDVIVGALNWYNHGNNDANLDYGDKAWSFSQQFLPEHTSSKVFP